MQTLQGLVPFDSAWWGEVSAGDVQVAPRNWLHGSMGLSRSFAEEWNALAAVDLFGQQSMQQLGAVIRERDVWALCPSTQTLRLSASAAACTTAWPSRPSCRTAV